MNVLVVGGAGYIGSHAVRRLIQSGHTVWVYDNCSLGHAAAVPVDILLKGDLRDQELLTEILQQKQIEAVMHFAAFASVPESLAEPAKYYDNNVIGTLRLLEAMRAAGVWRIVFSSTCAEGSHALGYAPRRLQWPRKQPQWQRGPASTEAATTARGGCKQAACTLQVQSLLCALGSACRHNPHTKR